MPEREIDFQQDFTFILKSVVQRLHEFQGIRFEDVRMEFPIAEGRADIALVLSGGRPFVLIETKRKNGAVQMGINPLSPRVIRQALGYAAIAGSSYFATANRAVAPLIAGDTLEELDSSAQGLVRCILSRYSEEGSSNGSEPITV